MKLSQRSLGFIETLQKHFDRRFADGTYSQFNMALSSMPFTAKQPLVLSRVIFAPGFWHSMPVSSKHTEQRLHLYSYKFDSGQECFNTPRNVTKL